MMRSWRTACAPQPGFVGSDSGRLKDSKNPVLTSMGSLWIRSGKYKQACRFVIMPFSSFNEQLEADREVKNGFLSLN